MSFCFPDAHGGFLQRTEEGRLRRYARLEMEVEGILRREIASLVERTWRERREEGVLEALAERRLDPYSLAGELLDGVLCDRG